MKGSNLNGAKYFISKFSDEEATANLAITNNVSTDKERYKAANILTSNKKVGSDTFTPGANVIYEAGNAILLEPGFTAEKWSVFKAEIKTCN